MVESRISEALVIKRNDWRESDSRVVLYTRKFGKLSLVARGAKKMRSKMAGHIEPMSLADIMVLKGKAFDYLGSAITKRAYLNIKGDLNSLYFVGSALSLFDSLVKEEAEDQELFEFLVSWVDLVENKFAPLDKEGGELLYDYFAINLLTILGYKPELHYCLECKEKIKPGANTFNLRLGGVVCPKCLELNKNKYLPAELVAISDNCIKILRVFVGNREYQSLKVEPALIRELSRLVKSFIDFS